MRLTLCAFTCLLLLAPATYAQSERGTITGTITDPAGAVVANTAVEAKNTGTGVVYKAASSTTGNYTLSQLPVGTYQVTATSSGFKQFLQTGITLSTAQTVRIDVKLEVGNIQEVVTVSADAPLLATENASVAQVVSSSRMDDLPIQNISTFGIRDTFSAVNLVPGGQEMVPPGSFFGTMRVNGMPGGTESMRIDGQDATETAWSVAYNMFMPGQDSMEEVAIQTSNYSAEFGTAGSAIFNMTMKSGTNRLHASAYEYLRNTDLDASEPYNHYTPVDIHHDYGFTVGGPVYIPHVYNGRDKTFFFFSFEQNRQNVSASATDTVPTQAFRIGDFSQELGSTPLGTDILGRPIYNNEIYNPATTRNVLVNGTTYTVRDPFPSNKIPLSLEDPVAAALQATIPLPTNGLLSGNDSLVYPSKLLTTIPSVKIDHNLSSKLKISGSWSMTDIFVPFPDGYQPPVTSERDLWETTHAARINLDYTITPTLLLHLGGGYMGFSFFDPVPNYEGYNNQTNLGLPGTYTNIYPTLFGLQNPDGSGKTSTSFQGNDMGPIAQQHQWQEKPTATGTLSWVKGNHTYKFGGEFRVESYPSLVTTPANGWFTFSGAETGLPYLTTTTVGSGSIGLPYAGFFLGDVDNGQIGQLSDFHLGKHMFSFFAQDTWKVSRKLTLDYGLRYDYETYLQNDGFVPAFGFNTPNPNYGGIPGAAIFEGYGPGKCNCEFASNYPYNFGPRLGIAYQINPKTVFRGGFAVSYAQTEYLEMDTLRMGSDVLYGPSTQYGIPFSQLKNGSPIVPVFPNFDPAQIPASPGAADTLGIDRHAGYPPRMIMWNIGIQRELSKNMSLEVSYVGNRGYWWNSDGVLSDPNRVTPAILSAHNFDPTLANVGDDMVLLQQFSSLTSTQRTQFNLQAPYPGFQGTVSQALRPYPQFGGVTLNWSPLGKSWYDSLQVKFTKRYSHGLSLMANYTFQKEEILGTETQNPAFQTISPVINLDNIGANKSISGMSVPHRFVLAGNYVTPQWSEAPKPVSWLLKDWNFGAYLSYQSGFLISAPVALNYPNPYSELSLTQADLHYGLYGVAFPAAGFASRVAGQPLVLTDLNSSYNPLTQTQVLNPAAWSNPASGVFGTGSVYYNDYRYRRVPQENLSLARIFRIREGMSLQFRIELENAFNRVRIPNPQSGVVIPGIFGNSDFAGTAVSTGGQRTGQAVMRINF